MPAILKIIKKVNGNNKKEDRRKKKNECQKRCVA